MQQIKLELKDLLATIGDLYTSNRALTDTIQQQELMIQKLVEERNEALKLKFPLDKPAGDKLTVVPKQEGSNE